MGTRLFRTFVVVLFVASVGVLACDVSSFVGGTTTKPKVTVQTPTSGSQFREGMDVSIQSIAQDPSGISRVELTVDGSSVRSDAPPVPQGQVSFTLIQKWKATPGTHTLSVRAFNTKGNASDPALITISVTPATASGPTAAPSSPAATATTAAIGAATAPVSTPGVVEGATTAPPKATATRRPPTVPPATPTLSAPPGVYALSVRVEPPDPKRGQNVQFFVTFLNTTGVAQGYRWRVLLFEPDKKNSFGDTSPVDTSIPPGTSEIPSANNWAVRGPGDCMQFFARVFSINPESKQQTEILKPDGSGGPAAGFQVCP